MSRPQDRTHDWWPVTPNHLRLDGGILGPDATLDFDYLIYLKQPLDHLSRGHDRVGFCADGITDSVRPNALIRPDTSLPTIPG